MDIVNSILEKSEDASKSINIDKPIELDIDEGTLLVSDYNTIDTDRFRSDKDEYLKSLTRDNTQLLINKIWALPTERVDDVVIAKLPKPKYILPRARVVPKPKPLTKWQKFAKEKGIQKNKKNKSKLTWDEELKQWIPTYGYKRAKAQEQKEWLMEVGDDNTPKANPRETASRAKEERVAKNELQRLRNLARTKNVKIPRVGLPTTEQLASSKHLATALTVARVSTASVGKFQNKLPKEKDAKGITTKVTGLKKKRKAPPLNMVDEKKRNTELVNDIISKKTTKDILQVQDIPTTPSVPSEVEKKRGKSKNKKSIGSKKPKAGKGKRDLHKKVGGRKRR